MATENLKTVASTGLDAIISALGTLSSHAGAAVLIAAPIVDTADPRTAVSADHGHDALAVQRAADAALEVLNREDLLDRANQSFTIS